MKRIFLLSIFCSTLLTSCVSYKNTAEVAPVEMSDYCKGTYVATISIAPAFDDLPEKDQLTIFNALRRARTEHGADVTVTNFRWDKRTTVSIFGAKTRVVGMTYDVIRCK